MTPGVLKENGLVLEQTVKFRDVDIRGEAHLVANVGGPVINAWSIRTS